MIKRVQVYKKTYEEDWAHLLKTFRENKYDNYFPGISDPEQEEKLKEVYYWAFVAMTTRFLQPEHHLELGTYMTLFDCVNHN